MRGHRILVTGGAGFIGSHLVEILARDNHVTVLDDHHRDALSALGDLGAQVRVVRGDVLDDDAVAAVTIGQDIVIHLAAIAGVRSVERDAGRTMRVNFVGTLNVLRAGVASQVRRCIIFSTSEVYGVRAYRVKEDEPASIPAPGDGRWAYAASKLAAEHLAMSFDRSGAMSCVVLRPFNIYGPRQVGEGAIHDMTAAAVAGRPIVVRGDGLQIRSWCFVSDLVDGVLGAIAQDGAGGQVLNLGNPAATVDTRTLAATVARIAGGNARIETVPVGGPDVELRIPSVEKARRIIGFEPRIGLEEGIQRTLDWTRAALAADRQVARS